MTRTNNAVRLCCALGWCMTMSGSLWAAQDNLLDVERNGTANASTAGVDALTVQREAQFSQRSTDNAAVRARVVRTEQQNLLVPSALSVKPAAPASTGAADDAGSQSAATAPDERPLWRLLHENRLAEYDRNLASIRRDFPSWTPPQGLAAERARLQLEADIAAALNGEPAALRLLIARAPEQFGCAHIDRVWKAADVFARTGHVDEIYPLYRSLIPACEPARNRIATLYRAERELPANQADALIELEASQGQRDEQDESAFQRLRYLRAIAALGALPPDTADAAKQLVALAPSIRAYRDAPAASLAGWIELAQHHAEAAGDWFSFALDVASADVDATLGLAQVRIEQRDLDGAQALLDEPSLRDEPRAHKARAQIALARATAAYEQHHYRESLQLLDTAASEGLPAEATDTLRGWNLYALRRYAEAAALFRTRYRKSHADDSAEGLALSLRAMHVTSSGEDRRVDSYLHALDAQQLYYRKEFLASQVALRGALAGAEDSQRIKHYVPAALSGIDAASVAGGLTWSDQSGAAGQGRLDSVASEVRSEWIDGTAQYELRYRQLFMNAGTTSLDQTVPGLSGIFDQYKFIDARVAPAWKAFMQSQLLGGSARAEELQFMAANTFRVNTLAPFDWSVSVGGTQGSPTGFQPNMLANIEQRASWGTWSVYAGVMPVRDSLLSWRGTALGADKWGAVRRAESGTQINWQVAPRWNINTAVEAQWLTGTNVVGNEGMSADLSGGYDLHVPHFDYFTVGPALHYLSYRRNENFFSWGQGGYYSPQSALSAGVALQWLSQEGRSWQWQGNLETGWSTSLQHTERCFPLGLSTGLTNVVNLVNSFPTSNEPGSAPTAAAAELTCAGSHDNGPYVHAQLAATVKLSPHWQAGALADVGATPGDYRQIAALAFLRYFFEPRAAVFSRDLPRNTRDFYLQLDDNRN